MGTGKKKIEMKRMENEKQRMVTFTKRRQGLFKKARQYHCLTGADIAVIVFSPAGRPYIHGDPSFDATVEHYLKTTTTTGGDGGGDSELGEETGALKSWLDSVRVEDFDSAQELLVLKTKLEEIRGKIVNQIDNELVCSFLGSSNNFLN
ncbi:hypothetical protein U1Q18_000773 [Sarracenia purpurea var. burkii]